MIELIVYINLKKCSGLSLEHTLSIGINKIVGWLLISKISTLVLIYL